MAGILRPTLLCPALDSSFSGTPSRISQDSVRSALQFETPLALSCFLPFSFLRCEICPSLRALVMPHPVSSPFYLLWAFSLHSINLLDFQLHLSICFPGNSTHRACQRRLVVTRFMHLHELIERRRNSRFIVHRFKYH